jgi:FKBP-type peptidyl-prolyl cis-trans isomerase
MAKLPQRIFAMTFAILFFVTTLAFAIFVIYDNVQSRKNASADSAAQNANSAAAANCQDNKTEPILDKPEVYKTTADVQALQVTDLKAGTGAVAKAGDCLVMKYYGTLATNGKVFDQNYTTTTGFAFTLGQSQVIEGWDKGLIGMKAGGIRRLVIPAAQAYGSTSPGESIPANSNLVFTVKLLRIQS